MNIPRSASSANQSNPDETDQQDGDTKPAAKGRAGQGGAGPKKNRPGQGQGRGKGKGQALPVTVDAHPVPAKPRPAPLPERARPGGGAGGRRQSGGGVSVEAVAPARLRHRHRYLFYTFILMVLLPAAVVFYYLYEHAQDRYASKAAFFVHREDTTPSVETIFGLSGVGGTAQTPDADVLYQFIQSQRMVEIADEELDLRAKYSAPYDIDPVYALEPEATLEDLIDYWGRVVSLIYEADSGLISLEVQAFTPEDAQQVANLILSESGKLIDQLSQIAQDDAIVEAKADLTDAETRLRQARVAVAEFRSSSQFVDPSAVVAGQEGVITALQNQLAQELIALDTLKGTTTRDDDPRLERADRTIQAIRQRIEEERADVGTDQAVAVGQYEELLSNRVFAETAYTAALGAYDAAVAEARRKSRYLAVHIQPTLAASSVYPQRLVVGLVSIGFLFLAWGILMLILMSVRDRR